MKTRAVLGYKLRLEVGKHYVAIPSTLGDYTPMAKLTITIAEAGNPFGALVAKVGAMPYDKANRFLKAFNNDKMIFLGRVW